MFTNPMFKNPMFTSPCAITGSWCSVVGPNSIFAKPMFTTLCSESPCSETLCSQTLCTSNCILVERQPRKSPCRTDEPFHRCAEVQLRRMRRYSSTNWTGTHPQALACSLPCSGHRAMGLEMLLYLGAMCPTCQKRSRSLTCGLMCPTWEERVKAYPCLPFLHTSDDTASLPRRSSKRNAWMKLLQVCGECVLAQQILELSLSRQCKVEL